MFWRKKKYCYVVSGWVLQPSGNMSTFETIVIRSKIITDSDFIGLKKGIITHLRVRDVFILNMIRLKKSLPDKSYVAVQAEAIANDRECSPPQKEGEQK